MLWFLKKIPPDKIFPRSYMDFEQKYQKDPGMNRVNERKSMSIYTEQLHWTNPYPVELNVLPGWTELNNSPWIFLFIILRGKFPAVDCFWLVFFCGQNWMAFDHLCFDSAHELILAARNWFLQVTKLAALLFQSAKSWHQLLGCFQRLLFLPVSLHLPLMDNVVKTHCFYSISLVL